MYVSGKGDNRILVLHTNTLRKYAKDGKINFILTDGGHRCYDVESYLLPERKDKYTVIYCRVSSSKQKMI